MPLRSIVGYGWKPQITDLRDKQFTVATNFVLATEFDLRSTGYLPPVWDQLQSGSCCGHGTVAGIMYARAKAGLPLIDLSRFFPYYNGRVIEGVAQYDDGAQIRDVVKASALLGDCPYAEWPTDVSKVTDKPPAICYTDAIKHKIQYTAVTQVPYHVKHCISVLGLPVVFGFTVYDSFETDAVAANGIVPMPDPMRDSPVGGHCVLAVGYSDSKNWIICRNSWGPDWGDKGYFYLPAPYFYSPDGLARDFWAVTVAA
jgi:C1A family cysteine protease